MGQDLEKLRGALRREDRQSLQEYVERLERELLFPKERAPEYLARVELRLRLAKETLQEKRRIEQKLKAQKQTLRRSTTRKPSDPPISTHDKYDPRGRAPPVSEPRERDRGVMKIAPRVEKKRGSR